MTVMRLLALALVSALLLAAPGRPGEAQDQTGPPAVGASKGAWPVIAGLLYQVEESGRLLGEGQRGPAMRALNAAHRLAEVGVAVARGLSLSAAHDASETIRQARRSIQNGAPDEAVVCLAEAAVRLRRLIELGLADAESASAVAERARRPRANLRLLGPRGEPLGEIDGVATAADPPVVVIETGSWINVLGFLDLGGQKTEVPAEQILFGAKAAVWLEPSRGP